MAISTMPSRIGPPSVIGKDDIREWRKRYSLRDDAILQGTCYELHELKIWWLTRCYPAVLPLTMGSFAGIKHEAVGELDPPTSGGKKAKSSGVATRSFHQSPYLILLQVMSQLYYFGEKMNTEVSAAIPEEVEALSR
ncbi:unnamed protein product [Brassica rapa]|uniref:Uncharacterized protein n=2 Tax=Brassica TaxID=3705 RepID=A0A8D9GW20_BRACM|nr:unnamed protein product [Brassica napus]CAG7888105.1 unnamed protein product [Brassica rapa]